jgi:uncharacterized protein YjbI with pentapeptide repeats
MLFVSFEDARRLLPEVALWKFTATELGKDAIVDAGMPKSRAEFLLKASAYPRGGQPAIACEPRARVGALDKTLRVVGNRVWKDGVQSAPEPFTEMPITWENAFGGSGFELNPLGKGAAKAKTPRGDVQPLPNVEDPRNLVRSQRDAPPPAGFGPYDLTWPQRMKKVGTYDQKWLKQRFPGFAANIDWTFFNTAPDDQQQQAPFRGDEAFTFDFMHPAKSRIQGQLPGAVARCFVNVKTASGEEFREVPTKLDTIWFFPHAERAVLVFHGTTKIAEDDAADVLQIVAACEEMGAPRPADHYRSVLAERLDKKKGALASLRDGDLMPAWPGAADGPDPREVQAGISQNLLQKNMRKRAEAEIEQERARLIARGVDPATIKLPTLPPLDPPPSLEQIIEAGDRITAEMEVQKQAAEAEKARAEEQRAAREAELRRSLVAQGIDPEPVLERLRAPQGGGPPTFSADEEIQKVRATVASGGAGPVLMALANDPKFETRLREGERKLKESYRLMAHLGSPVRSLRPEESAPLRAAVLAAVQAGESFEGRDLSGADLTGIELPGANLAGAFMEGVKLAGANLAGADLSRIVLARADLSGANLRGARLPEANLGAARLAGAQLGEANLEKATLSKADLSKAAFAKANIAQAKLDEVNCSGADFSEVRGAKLVFLKTDLSGVRFTGADLSQCTFLEVKIEGADFSGANLESATFMASRGDRALFKQARLRNMRLVQECALEHADFGEAILDGANLRGSKLAEGNFSGAHLDGADLSDCDLRRARFDAAIAREARFVRADLSEATGIGADLMNAVLQKATIKKTDLRFANLYQADLARVAGDERTNITGANVKKVRIDPKRVR